MALAEGMERRLDCDMNRRKKKGMELIEETGGLCSTPLCSAVAGGERNGGETHMDRWK